jgi:predicted TIM-barrel fold metal-dependent hydrolase
MDTVPAFRIFDSHFHIIDPKFPLVPNQGYRPPVFTCSDYLRIVRPLGVLGGAVVAGSFQGFEQQFLLDALSRLGPAFVGVTQLPRQTSDATIRQLAACGVRAIRFNLRRRSSEGSDALEYLARKVFEVAGWHTEIYAEAQDLAELEPRLRSLPQIVIDHLGLSSQALPAVLALAERGAKIKASGFGRYSSERGEAGQHAEIAVILRTIASVSPEALLFGTDLPSTRAPRPFEAADIELIKNELDSQTARRALYDNALALYRPAAAGRTASPVGS